MYMAPSRALDLVASSRTAATTFRARARQRSRRRRRDGTHRVRQRLNLHEPDAIFGVLSELCQKRKGSRAALAARRLCARGRDDCGEERLLGHEQIAPLPRDHVLESAHRHHARLHTRASERAAGARRASAYAGALGFMGQRADARLCS